MKYVKKWIAILASAAMFLTATGCEMSSVAGTSTEAPEINLTPEEKEQLNEFLKEVFGEDAALEGTPAPDGTAAPEGTAAPAETPAAAVKELTVLEQADALLNDPKFLLDDNGHGHLSLDELRADWRDVNPEALAPFIEELKKYNRENTADKEPEKTVVKLYQAINEAYEREYMQCSLMELIFDENITDEKVGDRKAESDTALELLTNEGRAAIRDALNGPYGDALKEVISPAQVEIYLSTKDLSDRAKELAKESNELAIEYKQAMAKPVTCEFEGKTYSTDDTDIPSEKAIEIRIALGYARSEQIAPIYSRLIKNRNEFAQELGYKNYIEYAYKDVYGRDYSPEDVKKLINGIFDNTATVMTLALLSKGDASMAAANTMDNETMIKTLTENIGKVSPQLNESASYLQKYGLYSFGSEDVRTPGAFMADLPSTRAGYIFIHRDNTVQDYEILTHEFGHYNNAYSTYSPGLARDSHMDVLEIHSQGLEMLASSTLNDVFPVKNGDYSAAITINLVQAVTSAMMVAAFELECFENPDMTSEELCAVMDKYGAICMFGSSDSVEKGQIGTLWTQIHHMFQSPLYYVSYVFAALSALDIYSEYIEDPQEGLNRYLTLVHISPETKYIEATKLAGLRDMTKEENIVAVMDILTAHYKDVFASQVVKSVQSGDITDFLTTLFKDLVSE